MGSKAAGLEQWLGEVVETEDGAAEVFKAAFVLADRLWSGGSIIVLIALVNSGLGGPEASIRRV